MEEMTKEEMQRYLIKEAQRGSTELEAYRNLMEILGRLNSRQGTSKGGRACHRSPLLKYYITHSAEWQEIGGTEVWQKQGGHSRKRPCYHIM